MKNTERKVQVWREGEWQLGIIGGQESPDYDKYMKVVSVVDMAIKKIIGAKI